MVNTLAKVELMCVEVLQRRVLQRMWIFARRAGGQRQQKLATLYFSKSQLHGCFLIWEENKNSMKARAFFFRCAAAARCGGNGREVETAATGPAHAWASAVRTHGGRHPRTAVSLRAGPAAAAAPPCPPVFCAASVCSCSVPLVSCHSASSCSVPLVTLPPPVLCLLSLCLLMFCAASVSGCALCLLPLLAAAAG